MGSPSRSLFLAIACAACAPPASSPLVDLPPASPGPDQPAREQAAPSRAPEVCGALSPEACVSLADGYAQGKGVPRDEARAARLYRDAAQQGADTIGRLQELYDRPWSVPKDEVGATAFFAQLCEAGYADRCILLGQRRLEGRGTPRDVVAAEHAFISACDHGDGDGCFERGLLYELGRGVPKDDVRAVEAYRRGCEVFWGPKACLALGHAYADGRGVRKDAAKAAKLFHEVCRSGFQPGCAAEKKVSP